MLLEGNIQYALTRVQAQYGRRLAAGDWRRLEATHGLGPYLEGARSTSLAPWVSSLDRHRDAHVMERSLRLTWHRYVNAVAAWHPRRWQPWLAWLEWLPTLPFVARLARPEPAPAWLVADSSIGAVARGTPAERLAALEGTALAPFAPAITGQVPAGELWVAHWQQLRPPADALTEQFMTAACAVVQQQARQLATDDADVATLRNRLQERLTRLFRTAAGTVVATLCYLGLMALDVERLRGGLTTRALFTTNE
jgi:hypothetical protein